MKIHTEVWIASQILSKEKITFTKKDLMNKIFNEFKDRRGGISTHISSYCVASTQANPGKYRYLTRVGIGEYRLFQLGDKTHPTKKNAPLHPNKEDIPLKYHYLLERYLDQPVELSISQAIQNKTIVYDFQKQSIKKIVEAVHSNKRILLSIATGLGRTHIIAHALKELLNDNVINHSLILTTRNDILNMFSDVLKKNYILNSIITPRTINRIIKNDLEKSILLSTIQSYRKLFSEIPNDFFDIIILDECHRFTNQDWKIINNHESTIIGFSAVPSTLMNERIFSNFQIQKPAVSFGMASIKLKEIAQIFSGANYRSTDLKRQGASRFIRPRDVRENVIIERETYVTKDFLNKNHKKILKVGDIILQNIFDFKKISLISDDVLPVIASNNFHIIRSFNINPRFLFNYLQSTTILKEFQKQLDIIATGATIKRIKINDLKEIFVPIPVSEEQINWFTEINDYSKEELIEINNQIAELKEAYKKYQNDV